MRRRIARHSAERPAGLFQVDRLVLERGDELGGLVLAPVGVGVDDHHLLVPQHVETGPGARHVELPVAAADLDLEAAEALREELLGALPHDLRPVHPDDVVDREPRLDGSAEEVAHGEPGRLAQEVPAGDVDGGLRVGVAVQDPVHTRVDLLDLPRVRPEQGRSHQLDGGPRALGETPACRSG